MDKIANRAHDRRWVKSKILHAISRSSRGKVGRPRNDNTCGNGRKSLTEFRNRGKDRWVFRGRAQSMAKMKNVSDFAEIPNVEMKRRYRR